MALLSKTEKMKRLLDRYFEGQTSEKEEEKLRQYFLSNKVDASLIQYREMFAAISFENEVGRALKQKKSLQWSIPISSAAACLAILVMKS